MRKLIIIVLLFGGIATFAQNLSDQVTIRRTSFGVPHVLGEDLKSMAFGLAYAQLEDRGEAVITPLIMAQGKWARFNGSEHLESDLYTTLVYEFTKETYNQLNQDTRDILDGFAAGVNYYLDKHPDEFPSWYYQEFDGAAVATVSNMSSHPSVSAGRDFLEKLAEKKRLARENADVGSNVWAFAPERTKSGNAILMRNPHLSWDAGYYEAHITVPGKVNFYGDFRIGGMFRIICGFNEYLGWSTTNNNPDLEEVYALELDTTRADHYLLDGKSIALKRKLVEVEFKNGSGTGITTKEWLYTDFGPVIERSNGKIYIVKTADWLNFRRGEQLTAMMLSTNLEEFKNAMRMRAISSSNYTYADRDGNIYYIWNASSPKISHEYLGDTVAHNVSNSSQIWSEFQAFEDVPQLQNPKGGYLQNSNDPFHLTNLNEPITSDISNYPEPRLRVRSQHSLELVHNEKKFSMKDIIEMKHSMRVISAERMKDDLATAMDNSGDPMLIDASTHLKQWDNTFAADSRGGILFYEWFWTYVGKMQDRDSVYKVNWDINQPMSTPYGINNADSAVAAMKVVIPELNERYGTYDLPFGEVYRVRRGKVDVPVGGGTGAVGNFRVLWFELDEDQKRKVVGGDGWVFVVDFGKKIKAYSILAYGQSNNPESPHFDDQAEMFANNEMKPVAFYEKQIKKDLLKSYHPGEEEVLR